ncbi:MAG: lysophospholipid acyltransferase family protein [Dehalococcoidia bacterium]
MLLRLYRRFIIALDRLCMTVYVRKFEVVGRENVPLEGPLILASNHLNNADPPAIALALPRLPTYMAKREMIRWPVLGPAFKWFGAFPVRRGEADLSALRTAGEVVNDGKMLVMFPEGTRSRTGGLTQGHAGTGLIALRTGAPVLPVAITGTEVITWPWLFVKPLSVPHVKVTIGEPFHVPPVGRINSETAKEATDLIMRRIAALLPPEYRGVYAGAAEPREAAAQAR